MPWNYERTEPTFETLPEGNYRVRIKEVEKALSSNGNDMLVFQFEVSGSKRILFHYLVFLPDRPEITNRNLTQFFDSFSGIADGDFDTSHWKGQVGAVKIVHEVYQGETKERIKGFILAKKAEELPAWVEPEGNKETYTSVPAEDLPF